MYRQVAEALQGEIQAGKFGPGQRLPSEAALVKRFGTSRITVGRALRELQQKGLIHGVAGAGNFVRPGGNTGQGLLFGLLIPNLGESEIFQPICHGLASATEVGSYALLWGNTRSDLRDPEQEALHLCKQFMTQRAAGVFFAPLELTPNKDAVNAEICAMFDEARIPVVLLDRCILPYPQRSKYDLVGIDNRRAGYLGAEHLVSLGSKRSVFLAQIGSAPTVEARIAGFREAHAAHGSTAGFSVQRVGEVSRSSVEAVLEETQADAMVCANDKIAGHLMHALRELNLDVPGDVSVVGIDDVDYARLLPVPLTTVHQPGRAIGEAAMTAMIQRRNQPDLVTRDILLQCRLVIRKSSGCNRAIPE